MDRNKTNNIIRNCSFWKKEVVLVRYLLGKCCFWNQHRLEIWVQIRTSRWVKGRQNRRHSESWEVDTRAATFVEFHIWIFRYSEWQSSSHLSMKFPDVIVYAMSDFVSISFVIRQGLGTRGSKPFWWSFWSGIYVNPEFSVEI